MQDKLNEMPPLAEAAVGRASPDMKLLTKLFDGFANPTRMSILALLARQGETKVGDLVKAVGAPQPRVSAHLSCLAWCGYVKVRREGRHAFYSIADERVLKMLRLGEGILQDNLEHVEACEVMGDC